jgi:hypothetical protein
VQRLSVPEKLFLLSSVLQQEMFFENESENSENDGNLVF